MLFCCLWAFGCSDDPDQPVVVTPGGTSLAAIQITPLGSAIARGTTIQLTATGIFTNGGSQNLTNTTAWASSNPAVATVTNTGLVTGVNAGVVNITATTNGITGTTPLSVTAANLTGVSLTPLNVSIARGTTQQYFLTGTFSDGTAQNLTSAANFTVTPGGIATINALGLLTATNTGAANVTGSFGGFSSTGNLTVTAATLQNITVFPANPVVASGFSVQTGANGTFSDGTVQNITATATFTSSNSTVANVSAGGNVSANSVGTATITATQGAVSGNTSVTVTQATLQSLAFQPAPGYNLTVGDVVNLSAIGTFSDGSTLDLTSSATWASNNTGVATVSNAAPKGVLTAIGVGTTQIGALIPNSTVNASANVTVIGPAFNATIVGLDNNGTTIHIFNSLTPGTVVTRPVTGLTGGVLVGLDQRPQNRFLYGLTYDGTGNVSLHIIDPETGFANRVGSQVAVAGLTGANTQFGFDFNPAVDRIRVVTDTGLNFRMNPNDGALLQVDGAVSGNTTTVDAAAYTNNQPNNGGVTTLYTLDGNTNSMFVQTPPNNGVQDRVIPVTLNGNPLDFSTSSGFDILPGVNAPASNANVTTGSALATLNVGGATRIYGINLRTGQATLLGSLAPTLRGMAALSNAPGFAAIGLDAAGGNLVRFNTTTPNTTTTQAIMGVNASERLVGLDYRPATGQLFGLGINSAADTLTVYRIDPQTGAATNLTAQGAVAFNTTVNGQVDLPDPATFAYGFDFNPQADRIRVTATDGLNFRLNPNDGLGVDGDAVSAGLQPDGNLGVPLGAAAYTNNFPGANNTSLYYLDAASDTVRISTNPNLGSSNLVGAMGVNTSLRTNFDIPRGILSAGANALASGNGIATLQVGGVTSVYTINLATGAATLLGGNLPELEGLTISR